MSVVSNNFYNDSSLLCELIVSVCVSSTRELFHACTVCTIHVYHDQLLLFTQLLFDVNFTLKLK